MYIKAKIKDDSTELFEKYCKTGDLKIRDQIIKKYINLVYWVCKRVLHGLPDNFVMDDIYTYGIYGLIGAIEKFDLKKNVKFKTYACIRIRGEIYDQLRKLDPLTRQVRMYKNKIDNISKDYLQDTETEIKPEELAKRLNIDMKKLLSLLQIFEHSKHVSMDENLSFSMKSNDIFSLSDVIPCKDSLMPENMYETNNIIKKVDEIISGFKEQKRKAVILYFFEDLTCNEIGEVFGVSESRISQIITSAKEEIKNKLEKQGITKDILFK
jgi:RNA polymerase sigma factor for flagellar operon FliA